jgi:uncharacterized repeat protein (TIGR01451 family)
MYHNTVADNTPVGIRAGHNVNLTLANNVLVSHTVGITTASGYGYPVVLADHTLHDGIGTYVDTSGGGTVVTTNDVIGDPAFVDPVAGDYHIGPGSAAIDTGIFTGVTVDIDGDPRPIYGTPDIGADEWRPLLAVKTADPSTADPAETVTYTIVLTNAADLAMTVRLTDTLPDQVSYLGPLAYPNGDGDYAAGVITWTGTVYTTTPTYIAWPVQVNADAPYSTTIANTALIRDPFGRTPAGPALVLVPPRRAYLPIISRDW